MVTPGELFINDRDDDPAPQELGSVVTVVNPDARPVTVGSHFQLAEANPALEFDRGASRGLRLDVDAGDIVIFDAGQQHTVRLIPIDKGPVA